MHAVPVTLLYISIKCLVDIKNSFFGRLTRRKTNEYKIGYLFITN